MALDFTELFSYFFMEIRPCIKADLAQCENIFNLPELADISGDKLSAKYLESLLNKKYFLVAEEGNKILGAIYGEPIKTGGIMIWYLAVLSSYRRKGIGHKLIEKFEKNAISDNKSWVILYAPAESDATLDFYKKHNYAIGNKFIECGKDL